MKKSIKYFKKKISNRLFRLINKYINNPILFFEKKIAFQQKILNSISNWINKCIMILTNTQDLIKRKLIKQIPRTCSRMNK